MHVLYVFRLSSCVNLLTCFVLWVVTEVYFIVFVIFIIKCTTSFCLLTLLLIFVYIISILTYLMDIDISCKRWLWPQTPLKSMTGKSKDPNLYQK